MENCFRKKIKKDLSQGLFSLGFKKKKSVYVYSDDAQSSLTLTVNGRHSYQKDMVVFSVFTGVSIRDVNRLFIKLTNCEKNKYASEDMFIVGSNIGYLMPQKSYKEWIFYEENYSEIDMQELIDAAKKYAFQYYKERNDIYKIQYYICETNEIVTQLRRDEYYPILLYLLNKKNEAIRYVLKILENQKHKQIEGEYYEAFAKNFINMAEKNHVIE